SWAAPPEPAAAIAVPRISVDTGHPWRPPFGLDRIGAPLELHAELDAKPESTRRYEVSAIRNGLQVESRSLEFVGEKPPYWATTKLESIPDEVRLSVRDSPAAAPVEIFHQQVHLAEFEADAEARPDRQINPVDLGAILVPQDWLLLAGNQA